MQKSRLEAFSDGVLAILITIMVLELRPPHDPAVLALEPLIPKVLSYVLSFIYLGIYWNNHHHMLQAAHRVSGAALWANLHLLFWLSLIPFVTAWMGENRFASIPMALYGIVLLMSALGWWILQRTLVRGHGRDSVLAKAFSRDLKGNLSLVFYAIGIVAALRYQWLAGAMYVLVALIWLVPDRRVERAMAEARKAKADAASPE